MAQGALNWTGGERIALFDQIVRALDGMSPELREIFVLSHYDGLGRRELADLIHLEAGELDARLNRANEVFFRSLRMDSIH